MNKPLIVCGLGILLLGALGRAEGADRMIATEYKPNAKVKAAPSFVPPVKIFFEEFKDERPQPQEVGENLENKGKRVLVVTGDPRAVGQLVRSALQTEFRKKGFQAVDQPGRAEKLLTGSILKFWTVETNRYNTQTEIRVEVKDAGGKVYYSKVVAGAGKNFGRSLSETNYNESFSDSLVMIVDLLLADQEYLHGLAEKPLPPAVPVEKRTAKPAPPPGRSPDPAARPEPPAPLKTAEPAPPPPPPAVPPQAAVKAVTPEARQTPPPEAAAPLPAEGPPKTPQAGTSPPPAEKEKSATGPFIEHWVVSGETLATIAKWYTGETTAWPEIAKYNPGLHPFQLKGGEIVKVPRSLATVHAEQPAHSTAPETAPRPVKKTPKYQPPYPPPPKAAPEPQPAFGPK